MLCIKQVLFNIKIIVGIYFFQKRPSNFQQQKIIGKKSVDNYCIAAMLCNSCNV